jgi:hypothetical protein
LATPAAGECYVPKKTNTNYIFTGYDADDDFWGLYFIGGRFGVFVRLGVGG